MTETHTAYIDTDALIRQLDAAEATPAAAWLRARSYQLLRPPPDATVVDVGCGTARAVAELAEHTAHAIGVDLDPAMLAAARRRFPDIDVRAADATELPLGDGQAHGYRTDKVYHVLPDPHAALAEARRVLVPGGRIALIGQDWDTLVIDSDQPELDHPRRSRQLDQRTDPSRPLGPVAGRHPDVPSRGHTLTAPNGAHTEIWAPGIDHARRHVLKQRWHRRG